MSINTIGWAGIGNMGTPMVLNLLKAGYKVSVYNRTREKEKEVTDAGAASATSLKDLSLNNDVVFVMVSDDEAAKAIFAGHNGLLGGNVTGKLFINVSTVAPATSVYLNDCCNKVGAHFLEAPVSGSVKPAQDATLIFLVGGKTTDFETAKPLLSKMGKLSMHTGNIGTGSSAKLAINYLLGLNLLGLAETVLFAQANGVKTEDMLTVINESACGNAITKIKSPAILKNDFPPAFALKHLVKDLRLAKEQGLNTALSNPLYQTFASANHHGLGEKDVMAVYQYLQRNENS